MCVFRNTFGATVLISVMGLPREAHDHYGQHKGGCMGKGGEKQQRKMLLN